MRCHLLLVTSGASLSTSAHIAATASLVSAQWWGDRRKSCMRLRDVALPQGMAVPPPAPVHGAEGMLLGTLSPNQLVSILIAWLEKSERWEIYKPCPACASALLSKHQLVHITHHTTYPTRAKQLWVCRGWFCILSSSTTSRIPACTATLGRNRRICRSWHIPSSWALAGGKSHRAKCKERQEH